MPASCALLHVQLKPLRFKVSQDQMGQEGPQSMILTWPNAFIVDSVKRLVQLMQLLKDLTLKTPPWLTRNSFITRKNCSRTETDGNPNSPEISKAKSEVDSSTLSDCFIHLVTYLFLLYEFEFQSHLFEKVANKYSSKQLTIDRINEILNIISNKLSFGF